MTKKECKCKDWKENIPILESTLTTQIARGHAKGLKKSFRYCPYCRKELTYISQEVSKSEKDIECNNCSGTMKYHKNEDILIPVGSEDSPEKKYKIICSVCRKELSQEEYERYEEQQKGLIFNWGQCHGKEAHPIKTTTEISPEKNNIQQPVNKQDEGGESSSSSSCSDLDSDSPADSDSLFSPEKKGCGKPILTSRQGKDDGVNCGECKHYIECENYGEKEKFDNCDESCEILLCSECSPEKNNHSHQQEDRKTKLKSALPTPAGAFNSPLTKEEGK